MGEEITIKRYGGNEKLDARFSYREYCGFKIYKNTPYWFVWDNQIQQTILIERTFNQMKLRIDKWKAWKEKSGGR